MASVSDVGAEGRTQGLSHALLLSPTQPRCVFVFVSVCLCLSLSLCVCLSLCLYVFLYGFPSSCICILLVCFAQDLNQQSGQAWLFGWVSEPLSVFLSLLPSPPRHLPPSFTLPLSIE